MGRAACLLLAALLLGALAAATKPDPGDAVYRIRVHARGDGLDRLSAEGFDIAGRDLRGGWVEIITDAGGLAHIESSGFAVELIEHRDGRVGLASARAVSAGYTDLVELEILLVQIHDDHPDITRLEVIGASIQGRPILGMLVSDNAAVDEDELSVLFSGAQHPREVMTVEAVIDILEHLTDNYGIDPEVTAAVDAHEIWCVPAANPDGLHIVFTRDDLWRKNARDNDGNGRINWKDGVDTNRNYEWAWGNQCLGSSGTTSQATYRGPAPATEPETLALIELGRRVRPVFDVEYHSYGEDVFYALGCDPAFSPALDTIAGPDQSISRVVAEQYATRMFQADGQPGFMAAPYGSRVDGIGRDQHAHEHGSIAFVTELNSGAEGGFHPDYATWRDATVEGQRPAWMWLLGRISGPAVGGHVIDATTGEPVAADLSLDEMQLRDGRRPATDPVTGRFHFIVVPGDYTLRVRASGYAENVLQLTVGESWEPAVVALEPDGSSPLADTEFEDPIEAMQWTVGAPDDDASDGQWEWGAPRGTHDGDVVAGTLQLGAPALDRTPAEGRNAYVTGNDAAGDALDDDDVDSGTTTLVSPAWNLEGWYGVELSWQQWLRTETEDPLDGLALEVSVDDGQSWAAAGVWFDSTVAGPLSPAWAEQRVRLDDLARPGPNTRIRFRATDAGAKNVVEAAVDDLNIRGFSLTQQGRVTTLRFSGPGTEAMQWQPVPGGDDASYEVVRGELGNLRIGTTGQVELGPVDCLSADGPGGVTLDDPETPPPGSGWFYLVRFHLGFSLGDLGQSSAGHPRGDQDTCASP